jgi:hypothetical protein
MGQKHFRTECYPAEASPIKDKVNGRSFPNSAWLKINLFTTLKGK